MKLSHLKSIIRESIKELQKQKSLLREIEECEPWSNTVMMNCPQDQGGGQVAITMTRSSDCSMSISTVGDCGKVVPGGGRAPRKQTMG